jgi:hypothetical protein
VAPTGLTVVTGCDGWLSAGAQLTWAASEGATAYRIYRSEGGAFRLLDTVTAVEPTSQAGPGSGPSPRNAVGYLDGDLGVSLTYAYRVQAVDGLRVSARSPAVVAETPLLCLT